MGYETAILRERRKDLSGRRHVTGTKQAGHRRTFVEVPARKPCLASLINHRRDTRDDAAGRLFDGC